MTKHVRAPRPMGRPRLYAEPMQQIALRLPAEMLAEIDGIIAERLGEGDRAAVIREMIRRGLDGRKQ